MGFLDFLRPIFGASSGALTPFTNTVAAKAVGGGADGSLVDGFIKGASGGALDALNFAKGSLADSIHDIAVKGGAEISKIPIIGGALGGAVAQAGNVVKGSLEAIPTSLSAITATPEFQALKKGGMNAVMNR